MCTNPITIIKKAPSGFNSPYKDIRLHVGTALPPGVQPFSTFKATVPCGKCIECLKRRQNDLAARCAREALSKGSMSFVTLTYDNNTLPLSVRFRVIDKESGEIFQDSVPMPLVRQEKDFLDKDYVQSVRGALIKIPASGAPRYFVQDLNFPEDMTENYLYQAVVSPSLNRRDVRLWIKRCRVNYKREFGKDLPEFSYVIVGEYGPKTCRPHYHVAFFGLDKKVVSWFCSQWQYGFTNMKFVNAVNDDGTPGYVLASKYIGKYMVKGRFECQSVTDCIAEKPRLCLSQGLGIELPQRIIDYYRAYDILGKYDIETLRFEGTRKLVTEQDLQKLIPEIQKRASITIAGYKFVLPLNIQKKIWYVKDKGSYRASAFRRAYSYAVSFDPVQHLYERLQNQGLSAEKIRDSVLDFIESDKTSRLVQDSFNQQDFLKEYYSSVF